jgi:hypothetical protein
MQIVECESWRLLRERWANYSDLPPDTRRQWWFRGQGNADWILETTLDRQFAFSSDEDRNESVAILLDEFKRELLHIGDDSVIGLAGDALELFARHHGLPSPLMDWTASPYVASYFAFEDAIRAKSGYACIWALNRTQFTPLPETVDVIDDFELLRFNRRALHQRGVFVRVATIQDSFENLVFPALTRFIVPTTNAKAALIDLELMTINATYVFGNEESAARTAALRHTLRRT